jgi:Fe-S-cluster containining protein
VVWVRPSEIRRLAAHRGLSPAAFRSLFLEEVDGDWSLASKEGACVFLEPDGSCGVYEHRPRQCRTWPFWPHNLRRAEWESQVLPLCPGAGRGRLYSLEEIRKVARALEGRGPLPRLPVCDGGEGR